MLNKKWNLPETYQWNPAEELTIEKLPRTVVFRFVEGEEVQYKVQPYFTFEGKFLSDWIGYLEKNIITRVAMSKYLTIRQIFEFMYLAGLVDKRERIEKRIKKLVKCRALQECYLHIPGQENTNHSMHYYRLDYWGWHIAKEEGVIFHKGNAYAGFNRTKDLGLDVDSAADVKRILVANQIILGLLKSRVSIRRFGVMETFRPITTEESCYQGETNTLFRPTMNVQIDEELIVAYEVVRDHPEAYGPIANKIRRYYNLVGSQQYEEENYHHYKGVPRLVFCGESYEHNCKIRDYLKAEALWNEEIPILFTEDLLNIQNNSCSIYGYQEDNQRIWYSLPRLTDQQGLVA